MPENEQNLIWIINVYMKKDFDKKYQLIIKTSQNITKSKSYLT